MALIPVAVPVTAPVKTIPKLAGLARVPPDALKSIASPMVVVIAALPEIITGPVAVEMAFIVPVKPGDEPSARLPPVPAKSTTKDEPPPTERMPPFSISRVPEISTSRPMIASVPSSSTVTLGSFNVMELAKACVPDGIVTT